ncbi:FMN reductase [Catenovulum agarivorans DS-2]|uniref:FMN reductase n=1 Tax=Catenovulum agarivorans DS-2 TaxID=1328313 RepID=W7QJW4_9ALTE|nr:NAD(P)H-flavin reductase [Catenovulum agarivorans]EWH09257.1 FMN reductase [Catenovulum agarivorans DS-2]
MLHQCEVIEISPLTEFVYQVKLKPKQPFEFIAGQYIELLLSESDKRPFSIANAPSKDGFIELQIGAAVQDDYTSAAMAHLQNNSTVTIAGPSGNAGLRPYSQQPVILMAGGTGFSYTRSIALALLQQKPTAPVYLYWGLRNQAAAYELDFWYAQESANFKFIPVIENPDENWSGRSGNVIDAVLADFPSLQDYQVYSAGRFEMVGKARKAFIEKGLSKDNVFADAFAFMDLD